MKLPDLSFLKKRWQKYSAFVAGTVVASVYLFVTSAEPIAAFEQWCRFMEMWGGMFFVANVGEHIAKGRQAVKTLAAAAAPPPTPEG